MPQQNNDLVQALNYHKAGNLIKAQELYNQILTSNPNDTNTLHLLAILHAQKKEYQTAVSLIEHALKLEPSFTLHNSAGNIFKNLNQFDQAIKHYQKSLALQPNCAAHNNLGNIYYQIQQFDHAQQHYQEAIKINPNYTDAYFNLGLTAQIQQNFTVARENFEQTLKIQPQHAEALYQLGVISQQQNHEHEAIKYYQRTLRIDREHIGTHQNLGVLLINRGKLNQALRHFKKILSLDPNHMESYHNIGAIFLKQKNPEAALKYFLHLAKTTKDFTSYYNLGTIYLDLGFNQDAIIYFNEALKIEPKNIATCSNLAAIYLKLKDYTNALKYYDQILAVDPDHQEAQYLIAALNGKNIENAPKKYIQNLFDNYAERFDQHLKLLEYNVPQLLYDAIIKINKNNIENWNILDLGCGTGLSGEKFRSGANKLIGIDLSPKMIEVAKQKNIYDELHIGDIKHETRNFDDIDLIISADTFVYFGDLDQIFSNCQQILKANGLIAFTVESTETYPYSLQKTARFAHCLKYIEEMAQKNNFSILFHDIVTARKQFGENVKGELFILKILK